MRLPRNNFRDLREPNPVLVAERQISKQVSDGRDAAFFERGGAVRATPRRYFTGFESAMVCDRSALAVSAHKRASRNALQVIPLSFLN